MAINRELSSKFSKSFQEKYNLGCLCYQKGNYAKSVDAFDDILSINSFCTEALANKALALEKLLRNQEARRCYDRLQQLLPDTAVKSPFSHKLTPLSSIPSSGGILRVIDDGDSLLLAIGDQIQGSVFKDPTAAIISPKLEPGAPGPVARSLFAIALLISASQTPSGSGLVLGLGCGAGPCMILANFPNIKLTVIDVNPDLIRLATHHFPLLQYYIDRGQLSIIEQDCIHFLENNKTPFDFIFFDLYNGSPECSPIFGSRYFVNLMCNTAPKIWGNIVGSLRQPHLHRILAAFDDTSSPIQTLFASNSELSWMKYSLNWHITTEKYDMPSNFIPFSELDGPVVRLVRQDFKTIQSMQISRSRAFDIAEEQNIQCTAYPDPVT